MHRTAGPSSTRVRHQASLFERLRADDLQVPLQAQDTLASRVSSIKRNLLQVLNARAGEALSAPDFGLEDFNDATVGSADMLRVVSRDIQRVITTYEPRVKGVQVRFDRAQPGGLELVFSITAYTRIDHTDEQVMIDLVLAEGRSFRMK